MSNTTVPISEWCKEIRVALARKEMNLQSVADEIGYSYTTITALISGRIVKDNYLDIAKKINEVLEVNVLPEKPQLPSDANGGAVGAGSSIIPEDSIQLAQVPEKADNTVWSIMGQAVSNESSKDASEGDGTTFTINNAQQNDGGGKVEVNVNMNPVIKIEGSNMDEEKIFQVLQNRIREMADDLGDEIAERMGKIFNNMPAVQEA